MRRSYTLNSSHYYSAHSRRTVNGRSFRTSVIWVAQERSPMRAHALLASPEAARSRTSSERSLSPPPLGVPRYSFRLEYTRKTFQKTNVSAGEDIISLIIFLKNLTPYRFKDFQRFSNIFLRVSLLLTSISDIFFAEPLAVAICQRNSENLPKISAKLRKIDSS